MRTNNLKEFGMMFVAGLALAVVLYGYNTYIKPQIAKTGLAI